MERKKSILAVNTGSSSIKFALYETGTDEVLALSGSLTRIGSAEARFTVQAGHGGTLLDECAAFRDHDAACERVFSWILSNGTGRPDAIGHRMVHGGQRHGAPEAVTPALMASMEEISAYAPEHLPQALKAVSHAGSLMPGVLQVACFDTAFHRSMPPVARLYPLPETVRKEGVERYGFHGLSYEYLQSELERQEGPAAVRGRMILAHLGHGASMAALQDGRSVETTMGFSPAGGLVMSTRTGDLDPGVILFLLQQDRLSSGEIKEMVNRHSGLLGVSGTSDDMRDLLAAEASDCRARQAVELFCYQARKSMGALAAVLGGLDMLVFTGGIGEHSAVVRSRICSGLEFLGIELDDAKNGANQPVISKEAGRVSVRVMKTNEELTIVRQTRRILDRMNVKR